MNIIKLSWQNLKSNPLSTTLSLLLMTLGVGVISLLLLINNQVDQQLQKNIRGIDMVIGAKGSPLQLILSSVYHIDNPTGNIPLKEANKITKTSMVDFTIPLSFGDSYQGFRIVGTTRNYPELYQAELNEGQYWTQSMQVVLGSTVAKVNELKIGDTFFGTHGFQEDGHVHDQYSYEVVGIMSHSNSTIDNLILTNLESVWKVHGHNDDTHSHDHQNCDHDHHNDEHNHDHHNCDHDHHHDHQNCDHDHHHESIEIDYTDNNNISDNAMITSMLVKFRSPVALIQLPRRVNESTNLQAAVPTFEIGRLTKLLGFGVQTINAIAFIIILVSGLSIFISLFNSLKKRRYELALMRVQGASKWQLVQLVVYEGLALSIMGLIFGLVISRLTLLSISFFIEQKYNLANIQFHLINQELWLVPTALLIGLGASLIPTILTYNINITKTLSNV
ncbi:MAG: ABC transporter permease [Flavobacteriales bacterium]